MAAGAGASSRRDTGSGETHVDVGQESLRASHSVESASRRLLILDDDGPAAELLVRRLTSAGLSFAWERVTREPAFQEALSRAPDIILSDSDVASFSALSALALAQRECPRTPFLFVASNYQDSAARRALKEGASGYVGKADTAALTQTINDVLKSRKNA